jgi:hypothetical protein
MNLYKITKKSSSLKNILFKVTEHIPHENMQILFETFLCYMAMAAFNKIFANGKNLLQYVLYSWLTDPSKPTKYSPINSKPKISPYLKENTTCLHYKYQSVKAV